MKKLLLAALISSSMATSAFAADGTLGATSSGSLDINLTIANLVKIKGLNDITLDTSAGDGQGNYVDAIGHTNFCVYANNGSGDFNITATGGGGNFVLSDGTNSMNYEVNYDGSRIDSNTVGGALLTSGDQISATGGSNLAGALTCDGPTDETQTIWVTVRGSELVGKPAATYDSVLTVQVAAK